ncbi:glycosyltransferase family 2 protein [Pigmentiphaga litoralis]|uniref:glycosyltransferase family 2 protein n=1 Tax=Pigmentiphaga litoralis TaxID=516702 RepID=UPI003B43B83B
MSRAHPARAAAGVSTTDDDTVSVCICTYRRRDKLALLLDDLLRQRRLPDQIVVVDNDRDGSARDVVEAFRARVKSDAGIDGGEGADGTGNSASGTSSASGHGAGGIDVVYAVQPEKNIALTRNATVAHSTSYWLAMADDDERAPEDWIANLLRTARSSQADGVLGPAVPLVPDTAPDWIRRGRFYDWARFPTGTPVPTNAFRAGNLIVRRDAILAMQPMFDPAFGLTGGEDGDLLMRMQGAGYRFVWCDDAVVTEIVEPVRLTLGWILKRARRGGQDFARHVLGGKLGPATPARLAVFFARAVLQMLLGGALAVLTLPLGRHRAVHWLARACANYGKLTALWGGRDLEYA